MLGQDVATLLERVGSTANPLRHDVTVLTCLATESKRNAYGREALDVAAALEITMVVWYISFRMLVCYRTEGSGTR